MKEEKKGKGRLVGNILLAAAIIGLAVALVGIFMTMRQYRIASKEYDNLQQEYIDAGDDGGSMIDFAALREINPDFVGWIEIPNTKLSYPVVQTSDNDYYIEATFERTYNPSGSIFLDARVAGDMGDTNSILYGHNMKDKTMFATVQNYCVDPEYRNLHDTIYFYTEKAVLVYEVFSMRQTTVEDPAYQLYFNSESEENTFLQEMDNGKGILEEGDRIITLSTCVNDGDPETPHRYIVQGVLREEKPPVREIPVPDASGTSSAQNTSSSQNARSASQNASGSSQSASHSTSSQ
ncbi:class B sortase [Ruminococcaceae bacterium OttesenSCG-928-I18]|nr:class B sortase [Ruminococcaceae bacterium OttesenSCG-928-I18]